MRKIMALAVIALGLGVQLSAADAQCLRYEPQQVVLTGSVQREQTYGPPGYGETPSRDAKEITYFLQLSAPICVQRGEGSDEPAESGVQRLQIAFLNMEPDPRIAGRRVSITGTLFHATTAHHMTPVLVSPDRVQIQ
ncbi:MAG TPA: DUF4431 domain-containing protein [Acidisphaera sp.]|nr:DUF4431 domain-containing protein [Acidisphaera sp.]